MPPNLRIALVQGSPNELHYSGSAFTGNVLLDVDEPKSYKQVTLQFTGRSYVRWTVTRTEGSGDNRRTVTHTYTSTEPYVDQVVSVWDSQQSADGKLPPGQYSWPFSFTIPPTAPSSFEGRVGNVRYALVAQIITGLLKFNHTVEVRIPVQQLVKLSDPSLLQPRRQEVQKTLCCLCCASAPIVLNVAVPKTGFCIGESFQLHISLENGSNRQLTIVAAIKQRVTYFAQGHTNWSEKTLVSVGSDEIEPQATRNWDPTIQIPLTEIVHESSCHNIKMAYSLFITCRIPRALNLTTSIPLQLGNCRDEQNPPPSLPQGAATQSSANPPPVQPGAFPPGTYAQPTGAFPPSQQLLTNNQPGLSGANPPPPYPAADVQPPGAEIGWTTQPGSDFPPPEPQQSLADFTTPLIEKTLT